MTSPTPQESDARSLLPSLLAVYSNYLVYRAAHEKISTVWTEVVDELQLTSFVGDGLAMIAARALARQREGLGAGAEELWLAVPHAVQAGVDAGLQSIAEALIWTDEHEELPTKDTESGLVPTQASPPVELGEVTAQAVAAASQLAAATAAGWRYKVWETQKDRRVRESHAELEGVKVSLGENFITGIGSYMQYPGDPTAPIEDRINCRCVLRTSR